MDKYDVAILGGGPGGYEAAIRCAQYGLKAALIEADELGGTCLNRGCIPTKALLHAAEVYQSALRADECGVHTGPVTFDYAKMTARKDQVVARLRAGIASLERAHGVTVIKGRGVLKDPGAIDAEGREVLARDVILATGARPVKPPIPGAERALTSDDVLALTECPKSLVIVGGGVIGIEFATLFSSLGAKVTVLEMLPGILPGVDAEIAGALIALLAKQGVSVFTSAKVTGIDGHHVRYEHENAAKTAEGEACVLCVGRSPATREIGLEALGVAMERGFVRVDERMRTNLPNLYAIGDITGKLQLAHVASAQGMVAANCAGKRAAMRYDVLPACIYTSPEIAYVGLTEDASKAAGRDVLIGRFPVAANGKSMVMGETAGLCKLVTDRATGEILGAQIMAPRASDMIGEVCAFMRAEGTLEELSATVHPHPTVSEIIAEAAHDAHGLCVNAMPGRK